RVAFSEVTKMSIPLLGPAVFLGSLLCLHGSVQAQKRQAVEENLSAQEVLTKFEKGYKKSGRPAKKQNLLLRMECLVQLMRIGLDAVPVLIECLKNEKAPAPTRSLSAQALGFLADDRARPILLQTIEAKMAASRRIPKKRWAGWASSKPRPS